MKRRFRLTIAFAACFLQALATFAAYAAPQPGIGAGDLCSVAGRVQAEKRVPANLPVMPRDHGPMAHCASCPGGSVAAALLPSPMATAFSAVVNGAPAPIRLCRGATSALALLPPSRGPPAVGIPA